MIDAKMVRDIATKYIYDRCPAVVGVGKEKNVFCRFYLLRASASRARESPISQLTRKKNKCDTGLSVESLEHAWILAFSRVMHA